MLREFFFLIYLLFIQKGSIRGSNPNGQKHNNLRTNKKQVNQKSIIFFKNKTTRGCRQGCVNKFFKS